MAFTHDYDTNLVKVSDLDGTHVLVGESGGLCAVYSASREFKRVGLASGSGLYGVETEHGLLLLDPGMFVQVIASLPHEAPPSDDPYRVDL